MLNTQVDTVIDILDILLRIPLTNNNLFTNFTIVAHDGREILGQLDNKKNPPQNSR